MAETTETTDKRVLRCDSIRADDTGLMEMDANRPLVIIPRAQIISLETSIAVGAERPLLSIVVGAVFVLLGLAQVATARWTSGGILSSTLPEKGRSGSCPRSAQKAR